MSSRGSKQGAGRANLRKREKTNGLLGLKTGGGAFQPKEKRENEWISRGLKQGAGQANLRKKRKTNGFVGAKNMGRDGPTYRKKRK